MRSAIVRIRWHSTRSRKRSGKYRSRTTASVSSTRRCCSQPTFLASPTWAFSCRGSGSMPRSTCRGRRSELDRNECRRRMRGERSCRRERGCSAVQTRAPKRCSPFMAIHTAVATRQDAKGTPRDGWYPAQKLTREEALRSYTTDPAFAAFQEVRMGMIGPGELRGSRRPLTRHHDDPRRGHPADRGSAHDGRRPDRLRTPAGQDRATAKRGGDCGADRYRRNVIRRRESLRRKRAARLPIASFTRIPSDSSSGTGFAP